MAEESLPLACPYLIHDPGEHTRCVIYELSRIRDIKQHMARLDEGLSIWGKLYLPLVSSIVIDSLYRLFDYVRLIEGSPNLRKRYSETYLNQFL